MKQHLFFDGKYEWKTFLPFLRKKKKKQKHPIVVESDKSIFFLQISNDILNVSLII